MDCFSYCPALLISKIEGADIGNKCIDMINHINFLGLYGHKIGNKKYILYGMPDCK